MNRIKKESIGVRDTKKMLFVKKLKGRMNSGKK